MELFFTYLIEASFCLFCFYLIYFFILKNETLFHWNRLFLLLSILFSLSIPIFTYTINIPIATQKEAAETSNLINPEVINNANNNFNLLEFITHHSLLIISGIYLIGFFISAFVFYKGIKQILILSKNCKKITRGKVTYLYTEKNIGIFSFFNQIFLEEKKFSDFTNEEKSDIIEHELAHIKGKHSLDLMLMEIMKIVFWFNPIVYFYKKSITQIHEYIADHEVIKKEGNPLKYAEFLVNQVKENFRGYDLCNNLFHKPIKSRLIMMKKSQSKPRGALKFLAVFPVIGCLIFYFCIEYVYTSIPDTTPITPIVEKQDTFPDNTSMPLEPEKGKCYARCMMPNKTIYVDIDYPVFTGEDETGVDLENVEVTSAKTSKWVKKKKDGPCLAKDPKDCEVWCLVETGGGTQSIKVVKNTDETDEYMMKTFKIAQLVSEGTTDWTEVICNELIDEELLSDLQVKLKTAGLDVNATGELDKMTKAALFKYQEENNLPKGNLNILTLQHLGMM